MFGLQRSGTNFLEHLLKNNYSARKRNATSSAWKHSVNDPTSGWQKKLPQLIIYKNPYTWIESVATRNKVDWLKTQKTYPADEDIDNDLQVGENSFNVVNLAKTYRDFHTNWLDREDLPLYKAIKYEDLLDDTKRYRILLALNTDFGWAKPPNDRFKIPSKGGVSQSKDYSDEREQYYIQARPKVLTHKQITAINEYVGVDLITKMGYEVL